MIGYKKKKNQTYGKVVILQAVSLSVLYLFVYIILNKISNV